MFYSESLLTSFDKLEKLKSVRAITGWLRNHTIYERHHVFNNNSRNCISSDTACLFIITQQKLKSNYLFLFINFCFYHLYGRFYEQHMNSIAENLYNHLYKYCNKYICYFTYEINNKNTYIVIYLPHGCF